MWGGPLEGVCTHLASDTCMTQCVFVGGGEEEQRSNLVTRSDTHLMMMNLRRPSPVFHTRFLLRTGRPMGLMVLSMGWSMWLGRM